MGNDVNDIQCGDIDRSKWYIVEVEIYYGGIGVTGCDRPYMGTDHGVIYGDDVDDWICNDSDCTDDRILIVGFGDAQRLIKIFGPWDTVGEAQAAMW